MLHAGIGVEVGTFDCRPTSVMWHESTHRSVGYVVVFPAAPVLLTELGSSTVVADRTRVVFHNDGEAYRRRLAAPDDPGCLYVRLDRDVVRPLVRSPAGTRDVFRTRVTTMDGPTYLAQRLLRQRLESGGQQDPTELRRDVLQLVVRAAESAETAGDGPDRLAPALVEVAEQVRRVLAADLAERLTLRDVADRVGYSPFHLARLFRTATGRTVQRHRRSLRLRAAVDRLLAGDESLAVLAGDLGFASQSHFTERFGCALGTTPAEFRRTRRLPAHDGRVARGDRARSADGL